MKKFFLFTLAALAFVACTHNDVEELATNRADVPDTLTIGFESDDTRIQLNEAQKTVWNENDNITVFYHSDANQKWQFQGETGDRQGEFKCTQNAESSTPIANIVVAYPYSEDYFLNTKSYNIEATLPAVQHYAEDSYGIGDNLMVAQSEFTQFSLKNVCGWLKVQLTGNGESVTRLTLKGNNGEQLAGLIYVDTDTAESTLVSEIGGYDDMENSVGGGLIPDNAIVTEITLNCGEGVELGAESKAFYIAVPPQTFEKGATVTVECSNGSSSTIGTTEAFTIQRNHILPIDAGEYDGVIPEVYELAYRTNDGKALDPYTTEGFGGEFEENIFDAATGEGKLVFAGAITTIPNQAFGACENLTWIEIPLGVTSIGASAFSGCSSMEEITIPASVTSVGSEAFKGCTGKAYINCSGVLFSSAGFAEVVIGDSVTTIGKSAFRYCDILT
ncbi:MAG: leucine-rich repeat domain-containing protein, partial [Alistipes sp.]|nr:leucine-rich repeat domain-containing protein [Alistipes sp.]